MRITLKALKRIHFIDKALINSHDLSLYSLSVVVDDQEYLVEDEGGSLLTSHHKLELQSLLTPLSIKQVLLRHNSAYDEMIGQPSRQGGNTLEVPLGNPNAPDKATSQNGSIH